MHKWIMGAAAGAAAVLLLAASARSPAGGGGKSGGATASPEGWTREEGARRFVGRDLYGHIDGGAELFYEFGFRDLRVERFRRGEAELVVETYRMEGPEAALGIYLGACGGGAPLGPFAERSTGGKYQIAALQGDLFVQVNNHSGDESLLPAMTALAESAVEGTPAGNAGSLLDALPAGNRVPGSERLVRGPYSLQAIYTLGEGDILRLAGKVFGVAADYLGGPDSAWTLVRIEYPAAAEALGAFEGLSRDLDPYLEPIRVDPDRLLFRDYRGEYGEAHVADRTLEIALRLGEPPK